MTLWTADQLQHATGGVLRVPFHADGVSIDSRTVRRDELFVALATDTGDGHGHVADALRRGAAGALVHRKPDDVDDDAPLLQVADTLEGLNGLARFSRERFAGRMVAVTGSVGKTTTKEMLRAALAVFGPTFAAEASHNNQWGVPLTLARLPPDVAFCVVEIGMNHPGEIAPLSRLAQPEVAAITAIAPAHIGHMGSIEAIALEKLSIAEGLGRRPPHPGPLPHLGGEGWVRGIADDAPVAGVLVLPSEGPILAMWNKSALSFGRAASDAVQLLQTDSTATTNRVEIRVGRQHVGFTLHAPGPHMADNAACALAVIAALRLDPVRAAAALDGFAPLAGRGIRRTLHLKAGDAILLDESYNASSAAVRAALHVLGLQDALRRIAVLGDMLELGHHGKAEHASLAPDVAANADLLFTCGDLMRVLHDAVPPAIRGMHADDSADLAPIVASAVRAGDAVLVKGSLGSRMHRVVRALETAV